MLNFILGVMPGRSGIKFILMENNKFDGTDRDGADHMGNWQDAEKRDENYSSEDRDEDDELDDDDAPTLNDWGDIDPQNNGIPDGNDPSAPGSAV